MLLGLNCDRQTFRLYTAQELKVLSGVLSGADIQKSRSSDIVMLAGKYGILVKKLAGN